MPPEIDYENVFKQIQFDGPINPDTLIPSLIPGHKISIRKFMELFIQSLTVPDQFSKLMAMWTGALMMQDLTLNLMKKRNEHKKTTEFFLVVPRKGTRKMKQKIRHADLQKLAAQKDTPQAHQYASLLERNVKLQMKEFGLTGKYEKIQFFVHDGVTYYPKSNTCFQALYIHLDDAASALHALFFFICSNLANIND